MTVRYHGMVLRSECKGQCADNTRQCRIRSVAPRRAGRALAHALSCEHMLIRLFWPIVLFRRTGFAGRLNYAHSIPSSAAASLCSAELGPFTAVHTVSLIAQSLN